VHKRHFWRATASALGTLGLILLFASSARAQLTLTNGNFDADPDLGGVDDPVGSPSGWFAHYTGDGTWSDFRFGNNGNGAWTNNGLAMGQNYTPDPGPEDGYYYTRLGAYGGETALHIAGLGYNRTNGNPAGNFDVSLISTPAGAFTGANDSDVAAAPGAALLDTILVDISSLSGTVGLSQPFSLDVPLAGVARGSDLWLRIGDGPEDGDLDTFDEPIIDNLTLTIVPEPTGLAALLAFGSIAMISSRSLRRRAARAAR
jgi:hypothetical protein